MRVSDPITGLSQKEAEQILSQDGPNQLPSVDLTNPWSIAWRVISEPMILLLIACGSVYLFLGDWHEAAVLSLFVVVMISIAFYQEQKTERALDALRELACPTAEVIRDGKTIHIPSRNVVRGDIVLINEGDRIPADCLLIDGINLSVDESLLTGESVPVKKSIASHSVETLASSMGKAGGDETPYLFSGTMVIQGKGKAQVLETGISTAIGKIGQALINIEETPTRVQTETRRVVKVVAILSLALAILLAIWYALARGEWMRGILVGITFAMAVIPEELPVMLSLFLGLGAWRIAQKKVLTRRVASIETLGSTTVLCVDKTGTLTQNKMAVVAITNLHTQFSPDSGEALPQDLYPVLECAVLASHRTAFDPMEIAIQAAGEALLKNPTSSHKHHQLLEEYPLSRELLATSRVWRIDSDGHLADAADKQISQARTMVACKGAPEALADLCHLNEAERTSMMEQVSILANQGLRILAVAQASNLHQDRALGSPLPATQHACEFRLLGLIALADPIRETVPAAIAQCRDAGLRVVMITGDFPATALHIAHQCGIDTQSGSINGAELTVMEDASLDEKIKQVNVFCRVTPEQKLLLVKRLRAQGEIVAMTGDGVNDAAALKASNIGIAMGKRGTDVARESSSLVLLDDDFSSIVAAMRTGRRIFDNLRKGISFIVAIHIPIIGLSFIPVMMGWRILLMPVHILVLQLLIDPTCSLVFEAETEETDLMRKPPRPVDQSIFSLSLITRAAFEGCALLIAVIGLYWYSIQRGMNTDEARAMAFVCIIGGSIGLIFNTRSNTGDFLSSLRRPNPVMWWVLVVILLLVGSAITLPWLSALFFFGQPSLIHVGLSFILGLSTMSLFSLVFRLKKPI